MTAGVSLDALSSRECAATTSLADPLVSSGGAYRPLAFDAGRRWRAAEPAALLALVDGAAWWLDGDAGAVAAARPSEPGAHFVGAVPTDGGGLLLLDARPPPRPPAGSSSAATAPARRRPAPAARAARDVVRYGEARTSFRRARSRSTTSARWRCAA